MASSSPLPGPHGASRSSGPEGAAALLVFWVRRAGSERDPRASQLTAAGFEVIESDDQADLAEVAPATQQAIVILALGEPDTTSNQVLDRIERDTRTAPRPVLQLLSAPREAATLGTEVDDGAVTRLIEPVTAETILTTLKVLIRARAAEQRAREAELRAAGILETVADPVVAFDRQWRSTYVSRRAAEIFGKSPEEMAGKLIWEIFPDAPSSGFQEACQRAWTERHPVTYERYSEALESWIENSIYPYENGAFTQWRDVTERKLAREELTGAKTQLRRVLASITEGFFVLDAESRFVEANALAEKHFKLPAAELLGKSFWEITGHGAGTVFHDRLLEAVAGNRVVQFEAESQISPGYWAKFHLYPREGGVEVYFDDITARNQAEQALRLSEAQLIRDRTFLETLLANTPYCICVMRGQDLRFTLANPAYEVIIGPGVPYLGRPYREVFPEAAAAGAEAALRRVLETGEPWVLQRFHGPTPTRQQALWEGQVVRLPTAPGEEPTLLALVWDVTDQAAAESESAASQKRLELALESAELGTWEVDASTGAVTASPRMYALLDIDSPGLTVRDLLRQPHPEDRERVAHEIRAAFAAGGKVESEFRIVTRDGTTRWLFVKAATVTHAGDEQQRLVGVNTPSSRWSVSAGYCRGSSTRSRLCCVSTTLHYGSSA